jgi:hypothetical protein
MPRQAEERTIPVTHRSKRGAQGGEVGARSLLGPVLDSAVYLDSWRTASRIRDCARLVH